MVMVPWKSRPCATLVSQHTQKPRQTSEELNWCIHSAVTPSCTLWGAYNQDYNSTSGASSPANSQVNTLWQSQWKSDFRERSSFRVTCIVKASDLSSDLLPLFGNFYVWTVNFPSHSHQREKWNGGGRFPGGEICVCSEGRAVPRTSLH